MGGQEDYLYWQTQDKRRLKRINTLPGEMKQTQKPKEG